MKKICLAACIILISFFHSFAQDKSTALLLIDIQNFYFPGGKSELVQPGMAAGNAAKLLAWFRNNQLTVIHVRHNAEPGGEINDAVKPLPDEKVISKDAVNCFIGTDLLEYLKASKISTLVICGMQTHMCVEAATRAASDLGFKCILIRDACTTKDLKFGDKLIRAEDVHNSTLSTLKSYATIQTTGELLEHKQ